MHLVFIYGPSATGKLTIATELAKKTGITLFHNHLTLNLARTIFPDFDTDLFDLTRTLRLAVIQAAATHEKDIIFTNVYGGDEDDKAFVKKVISIVESAGGTISFVQLTAPLEVLLSRVESESRARHNKMTSPEKLKETLAAYDWHVSVPHDNSLTIDTSQYKPSVSADMIIKRFDIRTI